MTTRMFGQEVLVIAGVETVEHCFQCGSAGIVLGSYRLIPGQSSFVPEPYNTAWASQPNILMRCTQCGCQWPRHRPDEERLRNWYAQQEYGLEERRTRAHDAIAAHIGQLAAADLVDVGTGTGGFLSCFASAFTTYGLEYSAPCVKAAQARGRRVFEPDSSGWHQALPGRVDVVSMLDVLEHVREPQVFLERTLSHLRTGGWLAIFTGDCSSEWARLWGTRWWYHGWAGHVSCFSSKGLESLLHRLGATSIRIVPMTMEDLPMKPWPLLLRHLRFIKSAAIASLPGWAPTAWSPFGNDHMLVLARF